MKKTILAVAASFVLTACATTAPTSGVQRNCMPIDNVQFWERDGDQVVVRAGARYYRLTVEQPQNLPSRIHSVGLTDRAAPIRYVRGPHGQMIPAIQRSASSICEHQRPTIVVYDSPITWSPSIPRQLRIQSIERLKRAP